MHRPLGLGQHKLPHQRIFRMPHLIGCALSGNAAAFLLSDLASGITGEVMYVDGGLNTTALGNADPLPQ